RNIVLTADAKPVNEQLTGPGTWGLLPLKSQINSSSVMVTSTWIGKGPLPIPSVSTKPFALNVPFGSFASSCLEIVSPCSKWYSIAETTVSFPCLSQISFTLLSPVLSAATCAHISPKDKSGKRTLERIISTSASFNTPPSYNFTDGNCSPS